MDYEKIKQTRNDEGFGKRLGIVYTDVSEGSCDAELVMKDQFLNLHRTVHGGILLTLADVTGGTAACSHGSSVVTIDSNYHFLRAGSDVTKLRAHAREIKAGRKIMVYDVTIYDQNDTLLGEGIFSYMPTGDRQYE
ncbi:MAG: PaaI family thioesterase [Eubacteriales bacterium]|nr:PaaI family thioesterase [Eubacteriales bacterium]